MYKIKELKNTLFTVTLKDGTDLCLQPCEETTIKENLMSDSLIEAQKLGFVSVTKLVTEQKKENKKQEVQNNE